MPLTLTACCLHGRRVVSPPTAALLGSGRAGTHGGRGGFRRCQWAGRGRGSSAASHILRRAGIVSVRRASSTSATAATRRAWPSRSVTSLRSSWTWARGFGPSAHALEARYGVGNPVEVTAFLTHLHWDHIIGLPFCTPLLRAGGRMDVYGPPQDGGTLPRHHRPGGEAPVLPREGEGAPGQDRVPRGDRRRRRGGLGAR